MNHENIIYLYETEHYLQKIADVLNKNREKEFVIICHSSKKIEDPSLLVFIGSCIAKAQKKRADLLLGGVKSFSKILEVDEHLFCIEKFQGLGFIVFFKSIFNEIIANQHQAKASVEDFLCETAEHIFVMYPFVTEEGNDHEADQYDRSKTIIEDLKHIRKFYRP